MGIQVYQIREFIEDGKDVIIDYCQTDKMIADSLTKLLVASKHVEFIRMCRLL